jgi:autotransporter-associated beta strand protein
MKTRTQSPPFFRFILPTAFVFALSVVTGRADSATYVSGRDWTIAQNWMPATVPNGSADTATIGISGQGPTIGTDIVLDGIVFNASGMSFGVNVVPNTGIKASLTFMGAGITNNSGLLQSFKEWTNGYTNGTVTFMNNATAGDLTSFFNYGGYNSSNPAVVQFLDDSSAGSGLVTNDQGTSLMPGGTTKFFNNSTARQGTFISNSAAFNLYKGGNVFFYDNSTAASGTFTAFGGTASGAEGGNVFLYDSSTAASGVFTAQGATATGGLGGNVVLFGNSMADQGTFVANPATNGTGGGIVSFQEDSVGGTARVEVFGNGHFEIGAHNAPGVTIGSLEGDGLVFLGANNLAIGSSNLKATFAGVITDSGSVTKLGSGKLSLTNANTYTGGTTVNQGTLLVGNTGGSGTGSGPLKVKAGSLAGTGTIAGAVTLGTGRGRGATLSPGSKVSLGTLTMQSSLTFNADAIYDFSLNSDRLAADEVVAQGVTIRSGAFFSFVDNGNTVLSIGTSFTAISNTAATSIAGTFTNLTDGASLTVGSNTFQANYEGGDGNDLTLTVVP